MRSQTCQDAVCLGGVFPIKMADHLLEFFLKTTLKGNIILFC